MYALKRCATQNSSSRVLQRRWEKVADVIFQRSAGLRGGRRKTEVYKSGETLLAGGQQRHHYVSPSWHAMLETNTIRQKISIYPLYCNIEWN